MAIGLSRLVIFGRIAPLATGSLPVNTSQRRTLVTKENLKLPENYPKPWPYKDIGYMWYNYYDSTKRRLHQNSKLIVVEGNIGSGKSTVAAEIADSLGFLHMPEFKMEDILIDQYGNDLRKFYHLFPESFRIPDNKMFNKNPYHPNTARMSFRTFDCRWEQHLNACAHIMNTGQGVVMERSPYTDFVFTNAMRAKNYIGLEYLKFYFYVRKQALPELRYWPHVVVYLDTPVKTCLERIKKRGDPDEISTVDEEYLTVMSDSYKDALTEFKRHSHLLMYDWSQPTATDSIVEDLEKLDLDYFEWHSGDVMEEWFQKDGFWWNVARNRVTHKFNSRTEAFSDLPMHEVGELNITLPDCGHFVNVMKNEVLKNRFGYGFQLDKGDTKKRALEACHYKQEMPCNWYEYHWKNSYYQQIHCYESIADPYGYSYNPDYNHHH